MGNFYLYLITDSIQVPSEKLRGINNNCINQMRCRDIFVWFSQIDGISVESTIKSYKIHNRIALEAMEHGTVLPFQFGTVVKKEEDIHCIIEKLYSKIAENLIKLSGRIEMGIKVFGKIPEDAVACSEDSESVARMSAIKSNKQSVNYLMERLISVQKERAVERYISHLSGVLFEPLTQMTREFKISKSINKKMLINASFLIEKENLTLFRKKVEDIKTDNPEYSLLYSGPWPPYNFINITLEGA